jgi:hypothetical protein
MDGHKKLIGFSFLSFSAYMMDSLPPNDPHRNSNTNNHNSTTPSKGDPSSTRDPANDGPIEVFGDIQDSPIVVAMFLLGVVTWFLRERCIC